jgi:hypothetical protein
MIDVSVRDLIGVGVLGGVVIVISDPEIVDISFIDTIVSGSDVGNIAGVIGGMLLLVVLIKGLLTGISIKERILTRDPEIVTGSSTPVARGEIESELSELIEWMDEEEISNVPRYVAMYGQKAVVNEEVPVEIEEVFDELITTAGVVYAEENGCSIAEGVEMVKKGKWCGDRKANAFLAEPGESVPCFTVLERLVGWVSPSTVFIARVDGVVKALEEVVYDSGLDRKSKDDDDGAVIGGG